MGDRGASHGRHREVPVVSATHGPLGGHRHDRLFPRRPNRVFADDARPSSWFATAPAPTMDDDQEESPDE